MKNVRFHLIFISIFFSFIFFSVYSLQAPYLISATALSDTSILLTWRNNDIATLGFIIQRKDSDASVFAVIDSVKSSTQESYTNTKWLKPSTIYTYLIRAYNSNEISDTSNNLQATTLAVVPIFQTPYMIVDSWNYDTSEAVRLVIWDSSNCETGFLIYRDVNFAHSFSLIKQLISPNPKTKGAIVFYDTTSPLNSWCSYRVAAYKGNDSLFFWKPCTTFTYRFVQTQQEVVRFSKQCDYPVSNYKGLSALAGDSIILKEGNAPAGKYSIINVKNPANPKFDGYVDSSALLSYPVKTLLPVFLKYDVRNGFSGDCEYFEGKLFRCGYNFLSTQAIICRNNISIIKNDCLLMFKADDSSFQLIDSLKILAGKSFASCIMMNDSLLVVDCEGPRSCYIISLSDSGFSCSPQYRLPSFTYDRNNWDGLCFRPYFQGCDNNILLITEEGYLYGMGGRSSSFQNLHIFDNKVGKDIVLPGKLSYSNTFNTGRYISPTETICTNGTPFTYSDPFNTPKEINLELFVSGIGNPHSRDIAALNNAIYRDTIHKQIMLCNILLDTLKHRVFLIFTNNLTVLSYNREPVIGTITNKNPLSPSKYLTIISNSISPNVTIVLPRHQGNADLFFYDLSGRCIDKIQHVTSQAVIWRPKVKKQGCYIVTVKIGNERYSTKIVFK